MAAETTNTVLTGSYVLVATAAVRAVVRASNTAQIRFVPTASAAPADTDAGITFPSYDPENLILGSACDVYARGTGVLQLFTNTV